MPDETTLYLILCGSAFLAGVMNSIAGGGTLLTFPALLTALGPSGAAVANATSTIALLPGSLAGTWGFRKELQNCWPFALLLLWPSLVGGLLGSLLLVWYTNEFAALVPWLILTAAVLFLIQPPLTKFIKRRQAEPHAKVGMGTKVGVVVFQFLVALYGGYFGAGIGILMLTALGFMSVGDIHRMNSVKTFLATAINGISVIVFDNLIRWDYAGAMALAAIAGGYAGARFSRRLKPVVVRWAVVLIGFSLAVYYGIRQYAG
jgi:uncharacterized protein